MQGQQVFITYGQQSNDKLLQYYGFVEPKASADDFKVHNFLAAVEADLQLTEGRRAALQSSGLLKHLDTVSPPDSGCRWHSVVQVMSAWCLAACTAPVNLLCVQL